MKTIYLIIVILIGLMILSGLGLAMKAILFPVKVIEKEIEVGYGALDKVMSADNAIYNYEWFKQKNEDIEATKRKLDNAENAFDLYKESLPKDRKEWTFEDKNEDTRLRSVTLGIENHLEQLIADYNARAKMATRNIFEDSVLPDYIDALTFIRK